MPLSLCEVRSHVEPMAKWIRMPFGENKKRSRKFWKAWSFPMPKVWWAISEEGLPLKDGRVVADTYEQADKILFYRILHGQCPFSSFLIEELPDDEVSDKDILSVDEIVA
jgi:hypothetical protein